MPASSPASAIGINFVAISLLPEGCTRHCFRGLLSKACAKQRRQALPAFDRHIATAADPAALAFDPTEFDEGLGRKTERFCAGPGDTGIHGGNVGRDLPNLDPV